MIVLFVFAVAPLLLAWFTAFKTDQQLLTSPYGLPLPPTLDNLREAWTVGRFSIYFKNSLIISIADVIGMVIISSSPATPSPASASRARSCSSTSS